MWTYVQPVITVFSEQASQNIAKVMAQQGLGDALLIADPFLVQNGTAQKIKAASGGRILDVIGDVDPNPTFDNVDHCLEKAKQISAKCVIALGGGSSIDTGKCVCVALANQCTAADLGKLNAVKTTPLIAIPTTAGTGSEVTAGAVISDPVTGTKSVLSGIGYLAKMAVVDPMLTYLNPVADKWRDFKWNVIELDGHDTEALVDAFDNLPPADSDVPTMIVANTIKGKGVAAMENNPAWHMGGVMVEYGMEAKEELDDAFNQKWGAAN